jgi:hypothetical protein
LADSPKADSLRVDRSEDRERVLDLKLEAATTGFASRLTLAAAVERDDANARRRQ